MTNIMKNKFFPFAVVLASALGAGCGGSMGTASSADPLVVGPAGARIFTSSGMARLDIPQDALQAQVEIQLAERFDAAGRHEVEVQPAELRFAKPAKLTFKVPDNVRPELEHAVEVQIQNQVEVEVEVQKQVCDVVEREIEAQIQHTGKFRREDRPL